VTWSWNGTTRGRVRSTTATDLEDAMSRSPLATRAVVIATLPLALLALSACAASSTSSDSAVSVAPAPAAAGVMADQAVGGNTTGTATGEKAPPSLLGAPAARSIVVHADLSVAVQDVTASTSRIAAVAAAHRAEIASQSTTDGVEPVPIASSDSKPDCSQTACPSGYATSVTTLRVDNAEVDALLRDLRALGTVRASSRTADDVTAQVADVGARVASARASLDRIRVLMSKATTIGEVVQIEGELSSRQADLESLEAQQRALADQTAQATVTVTLVSDTAPAPSASDGTGFVAGLHKGWDAFSAAFVGALTVVGALLPFAVVLVPLGYVAWRVVRRTRRHDGPASPAEVG
jgi:hypothetical protein